MTRFHGTNVSLVVLTLLVGAFSADAQAQDIDLTATEALETDADILAATYGWNVNDTITYLNEQEAFNQLAEDLYNTYPGSFSSSIYADYPGAPSEVRFKGAAPLGALLAVASSGLDVNVVDGFTMTYDELEANADAITDYLATQGYTNFSVAFNEDELFEVTLGGGQSAPSLPSYLPSSVLFETWTGAVEDPLVSRGGMAMFDSSNQFQCTSGFSVETVGQEGPEGVTTAAHCPALATMSSSVVLNIQNQHEGNRGDMEWHTTPSDNDVPKFVADTTATGAELLYRPTRVQGWFSRGNVHCYFGRTTNDRYCSKLFRVSVSVKRGATTVRRLAVGKRFIMNPGDSGGPVSSGTTAAGIITSHLVVRGAYRVTFTKAKFFDDRLGVQVKL